MTVNTALPEEIAKFDAMAERWWDPSGPMAPLHQMNPVRCGWIADHIRKDLSPNYDALSGIRVLDVGCGAGLASEGLARRGARVTGIDAAGAALAAARAHARQEGLDIDYRQAVAEDLVAEGACFDAVMSLEVIEHVADRPAFLSALSELTRPQGLVFISTINKTAQSLVMAKFGAEYVLRLLPRGTHRWDLFVAPSTLSAEARRAGLRMVGLNGMVPDLARRSWRISQKLSVNYIAAFRRD